MVSSSRQSLYREPLRPRQPLPALGTGFEPVSPGITPALSLILAHAPDRNPPSALGPPLCLESLQVAARPPAGSRSFPALPPRISPQVPGPLPRRSPWCIYSFLPMGHRPSPFPKWVGMPQKSRPTTSVRRLFSGLQSFAHVQAPGLARHPGRSHRKAWFPTERAAVTFTSTHISVRYLTEQWIC